MRVLTTQDQKLSRSRSCRFPAPTPTQDSELQGEGLQPRKFKLQQAQHAQARKANARAIAPEGMALGWVSPQAYKRGCMSRKAVLGQN